MLSIYLIGCIAAAVINFLTVDSHDKGVSAKKLRTELLMILLSWLYVLIISFVFATSYLGLIDWEEVAEKVSNWLDKIDKRLK